MPSAKMTDQDQPSAAPPKDRRPRPRWLIRAAESMESVIALSVVAAVITFATVLCAGDLETAINSPGLMGIIAAGRSRARRDGWWRSMSWGCTAMIAEPQAAG